MSAAQCDASVDDRKPDPSVIPTLRHLREIAPELLSACSTDGAIGVNDFWNAVLLSVAGGACPAARLCNWHDPPFGHMQNLLFEWLQ
ncbi:hypothetical protein P9250_32135 [Caballeronia sp. LP006]|uniref:hypothetical protein n=1 Tax=Caballeronia sp. LP006 TaxID=3038552 RepID=UPI0028598FA8|nr:hypothetical protein [Caballeronia sp. LP006]MDR5832500.1 hypothetical protein [Caballeronia sp. LP006]